MARHSSAWLALFAGASWFLPALFCALAFAAGAQAACTVQREAEAPFVLSPYGPLVTAVVNGQEATFVLDTGAVRSVVDEAAVARLHLPLDEWASMTMQGVGGVVRHRVADLRDFTLGGAKLRRRSLANDMSVAVVPSLPFSGTAPPIAGLLGADYLLTHDLALDPVARTVALYDVRGCAGRFLPWTGAYDAAQAMPSNPNWLVLPARLEGHALRALVDTGAAASLVTTGGALRLGWSAPARNGAGLTVRGLGAGSLPSERRDVQSLAVGSDTGGPLSFVVVPYGAAGFDVVLGADWLLRRRRVWLSYQTGQVFFGLAESAATNGNISQ